MSEEERFHNNALAAAAQKARYIARQSQVRDKLKNIVCKLQYIYLYIYLLFCIYTYIILYIIFYIIITNTIHRCQKKNV